MPHSGEPAVRPDGLQLDENRSYQETLWTVERWAWLVFIAITLAAALGATGAGGPLSHRLAVLEGGQVDHPRIARWAASEEMAVHFAAGSGPRTLMLSPAFAQSFQIEGIQPEPDRVEATAEGQVMHFDAADGPIQVVIHLRPQSPSLATYRVSLNGGTAQSLSTLILP